MIQDKASPAVNGQSFSKASTQYWIIRATPSVPLSGSESTYLQCAPSAPQQARIILQQSSEMLVHWQRAQDSGGGCGCGLAT